MPTVDEMKAAADKIGLKYPSKIKKADLAALLDAAQMKVTPVKLHPTTATPEEASEMVKAMGENFPDLRPEAQHRMAIDAANFRATPSDERARSHRRAARIARRSTPRALIRAVRASQSRRYGQGDRGVGAKHYGIGLPPEPRTQHRDATKPLAYGDRVRHYAKQLGLPTASADGFPGPALTARQWRRLDKKDNVQKFIRRGVGTKERRYV